MIVPDLPQVHALNIISNKVIDTCPTMLLVLGVKIEVIIVHLLVLFLL
jgi:hypothetical protein